MSVRLRWLARQFARPSGLAGRLLIAPWLDRISRRANRLALERLAPAPGERVLELGFGGGGLLGLVLQSKLAKLIAVDASRAMVRRAARRFAASVSSDRLELLHARAEALPLGGGSIDAAVSVSSLYFWDDLHRALTELARVLRPGGRLVLVWEAPETLRRWPGHRFGFHIYDDASVIAAAAGANLLDPVVRSVDGFLVLSLRRGADMEGA
ncbi:MAG TPA: class I SAM-dependent methyltransferase [Allosphingosinicella sp.]|jgi:SAM-dependent methyltransferase